MGQRVLSGMTSSRVALVTGATEGIGRAVAFSLGRAGWSVGVCARTPARLERLLLELRGAGVAAEGLPADVGDEAQVKGLVQRVSTTLGTIDTLVNNAGMLVAKPFLDLTLEDWDATMRTNLRSLFLVTREVLPGMRTLGRGDIVNISSLAGRNGFVGGSATWPRSMLFSASASR
jgi:NAD(P)-dependent dehydrogenase (short-subunit alcohol dehydrogenase family)